MTLELFSGILIFLAICIVPCIPLGYLLYLFLRELITIIKRTVAEAKLNEGSEERAGWFKEYLLEQLQKQEKIKQLGKAGYYCDKAKAFWKEYRSVFYMIGMLLLLLLVVFRSVIIGAVVVVDRLKHELPVNMVLYYGLVLLGLLLLLQLVRWYKQRKQQSINNHQILERLQAGWHADDEIVQLYQSLMQHRKNIGEKSGMFQKLRDDDEIDEMRMYLEWLEQKEALL